MSYRLDYMNDDGSTDPVRRLGGDDFRSEHASTARQRALSAAAEDGRAILLSRLDANGNRKPTMVVQPDGSCLPPAGMESAHDANARVCFCPACRAQRKVR